MDLCGPMEPTAAGNRYVLVIGDYFSKFTMPIAVPDKTQEVIAEALVTRWISLFGIPDVIHTDRGREFDNYLMRELCERFHITKTRTCSYHPASNGVIERYNSSFAQIVGMLCNEQQQWDLYLSFAQMSYNATVHNTTGETPNKVVFGDQLRMPIDVMTPDVEQRTPVAHSEYVQELERDMRLCGQLVRQRTQRAARCHKNYYDRRQHEVKYKSKDLVMLKTMAFLPFQRKFQDRYTGPWTVIEGVYGNCYRIQLSEHEKPQIVHHDRLKPYQARNVEQHNTDWVDRVKARYASNKSVIPRQHAARSKHVVADQADVTSRESNARDKQASTSEELSDVLEPATSENVTTDNFIAASRSENDPVYSGAARDSSESTDDESTRYMLASARSNVDDVSLYQQRSSSEAVLSDMLASGGDANDQASLPDAATEISQLVVASGHECDSDNESVCSIRSTAEYSVAEFMAPASFKSGSLKAALKREHQRRSATRRCTAPASNVCDSTDSENDTIELAQSQFMFESPATTPLRSQRYGLRRRPRQRQVYSP